MSILSDIQVLSDRRIIRLRHNDWAWKNLDRAWREDTAEKFLKVSGLDMQWEMTDCYADREEDVLGISLSRREEL